MPELRLHVIPKDPKEQHIAEDVRKPGVQEHARYERQKRRFKGRCPVQPTRNSCRHHRVRHDKRFKDVRSHRQLIEEHSDVRQQQTDIHERKFAGRIFVPQRKEHSSSV